MCASIAVMYLGKIVESGPTTRIFEAPRHPYTQSLLAAVPRIGGRRVTADFALEGEPQNTRDVPSGCRLRTRCCPLAEANSAAQRSRNSASIFVRSRRVVSSMNSSSLWARLPLGPTPSSVGAMAEV